MCQVIIPANAVVPPRQSPTDQIAQQDSQGTQALQWPPGTIGDLRDGDPVTGVDGGQGGTGGSPHFFSYNNPNRGGVEQITNIPPADTPYGALANTLVAFRRLDWTEKGSPPNPNIYACYVTAGRSGYTRDSGAIDYAWCAAFVSHVLATAGLGRFNTMGSQEYKRYGRAIDWRDLSKIRKYDIAVLKSRTRRGGHVGFVWAVEPGSFKIQLAGGNQGDNYKVSNYWINNPSADLYLTDIRRNWDIPSEYDIAYPTGDTAVDTGGITQGSVI